VGNVRREDGSPDHPHIGPVARKGVGWIKLAQGRVNAVMNFGSTKRFFLKVNDFVFETGLSTNQTRDSSIP